ncbi:GNAT family N-acetyltransferase [Plantactinospora siamensis]|uniref:GNAT family N-acetyltransferase n=1 Tax=Plantactinospora siamensis TaxID=555372 RepID=A0ABV6NVF9_9ACTN
MESSELLAMQRAVQRGWTNDRRWHVGDLAWQRYHQPGREAGWRTRIWRDGAGEAIGWGWLRLPGQLDLHVDPRLPELAGEVLDWFAATAPTAERTVTVLSTEGHLRAALERAGYGVEEDAPHFAHHLQELDADLPVPAPPAGYRIRPVRPDEAAERAAVHRAAWRPARIGTLLVPPEDLGDGESRVTTESYGSVMAAWPYRTDLDQVVEAADGTLAASALGWLDADNRVGLLEPVGTDPRHARLGLGAAVSLACLHAMRAAGATRVVVRPRGDAGYPVPGRLYRALGFRETARTVAYRS